MLLSRITTVLAVYYDRYETFVYYKRYVTYGIGCSTWAAHLYSVAELITRDVNVTRITLIIRPRC